MSARRLVPLGLLVAALLAAAGIASHGRPLSGSHRGTGPTAVFFDYVATTLVLVAAVFLVVSLYAVLTQRAAAGAPRRGRWHVLASLAAFAIAGVIAAVVLHTGFIERFRRLEQQLGNRPPTQNVQRGRSGSTKNTRNARLRWDEISVFLVLVAGTGVILYARGRTRRPPKPWRFGSAGGVTDALDESIDDLRNDPDLRRAIIAAYARMEHALGRAGIARRPSEAPFEYMERALLSLDTSTTGAERLTGLFERAKFSQHEPAPEMRDEAIAALIAVRDDLAREPVTA